MRSTRNSLCFGLARNKRLQRSIGAELHEAMQRCTVSGHSERVFKELTYSTQKSWSRARRVVAKAEATPKGENPRFIVTSLSIDELAGRELYEQCYCARGEAENRIKECQLDLFAANQLRLWLASFAYVLIEWLRRRALTATRFAQATAGTIRLKLLKIGATVKLSVRRVKIAMSSAHPYQAEFSTAWHALLAAAR